MSRLVIGVGNPFRSDDAAGLAVAERLESVPAAQSSLGGFELMDLWEGADEVVIVDATHSEAAPGTIVTYDAVAAALPADSFASSHAIGVAETIELARRLGRLPQQLTVYGIEAEWFEQGTEMSTAVRHAVERVAAEVDHA